MIFAWRFRAGESAGAVRLWPYANSRFLTLPLTVFGMTELVGTLLRIWLGVGGEAVMAFGVGDAVLANLVEQSFVADL